MRSAIAIVAVGAFGIAIYDQYDRNTNFQRVEARIATVNEQCYLEKVERGAITKTTFTSDPVRCEVAELLRRDHPKWQGYNVKHKFELRVTYVSPVDSASHTSSLQLTFLPNGKPLRAGDPFPILASKTKVDETRI